MPIIEHSDYSSRSPIDSFYTFFPDQFISKKVRESDSYIKYACDYFYTVALQQYNKNTSTFVNNYRLVKGILRKEDFYEHSNSGLNKDYVDSILGEDALPDDIQHYSIFTKVLNTMVGEMSKRPDNAFIKAFDDDSKSEELQFKTELLNQYIFQKVQEKIVEKAALQGIDLDSPEGQDYFQKMTEEQLMDKLSTYTSQAEKWGNRVLEALKMEFNLKEISEEAFRDLLISGRERFHVYEDKSKIGFNVECVNPKNCWYLSTPDKKYLKDSFAAGIIEIMEISEIIRKYPLTKKEIDYLRERNRGRGYIVSTTQSNLFSDKTGINSINYDTYDPAVLTYRLNQEAQLMKDQLDLHLGQVNSVGTYGDKFVVVTSYFILKKKVGKLTFINSDGIEEVTIVDENYKSGEHPQQIDLEWGYIDQWYKGLKIDNVYYMEPLKILDYCPIIGVDFERKNVETKSLIDMMKPFQAIYNLNVNQLWRIAQKEYGVVFGLNPRKVPTLPDGTEEDAVEVFKYTMMEEGIALEDDSPENTQVPTSNTSVARRIDLTRAQEMASRIQNAQWAKEEAYDLVGFNRERGGGILATQTATGAQANLSQSYAATESWFTQHEICLNQLYQAVIDAAQYTESQKENSTISYISNEGEHAFIQINGTDLKLKDLRVYVTSRAEDQKIFQQIQQLAQPMLQNGALPIEIVTMFSTKSIRKMEEVMQKVNDRIQQEKQQQIQLQQQQIQSQQQIAQAQLQAAQQKEAEDRNFQAYQNELDRQNKLRIATIQASSKSGGIPQDTDNSGLADAIELTKLSQDAEQARLQYELQQSQIAQNSQQQQQKLQNEQLKAQTEKEKFETEAELKREELRIKEKQTDNQLKIAQTNRNKYSK